MVLRDLYCLVTTEEDCLALLKDKASETINVALPRSGRRKMIRAGSFHLYLIVLHI